MLNDLRKYECLGTPSYFLELVTTLSNNRKSNWNVKNASQIFSNKIFDNRPIIDGGIELGIRIGLLNRNQNQIELSIAFDNIKSKNQLIDKFNQNLIHALSEEDEFLNIFCSRHLSHDIVYKSLQLDNRAFAFKFANFKQLLIDFKILYVHPQEEFNSYILNTRYKKLFDKLVLPEIKKRSIGIDEFRKSMEHQAINGEEAEKFVVKFEEHRLNNKKVEWVAQYIVNQGYDIASYNLPNDDYPNRFIEVKSYVGDKPYFFWSRNEYSVAESEGKKYWIYLVNRNNMKDPSYVPLMIQDPFINILENKDDWKSQVEKYKFNYK